MRKLLMTPGPFQVPQEVLNEMAEPLIHHRTAEYREIFKEVLQGLKVVFRTQNEVIILTASGTGAMEAAVVNSLAPSEKALVVMGGKFGERWGEICKAYGIAFEPIEVEWGKAVDPKEVERRLTPDVKAVFTTLCETSTGVAHDIEAIGSFVSRSGALLVVDGISAVGAVPCETDAWGIDLLVVGSQKALMIPPGLAFVAVSKRAWERIEKVGRRGFYFDLVKSRKAQEKVDSAFTPAISLVIALRKSLRMIQAEGIEQVWRRHATLARATRAGLQAMGLTLYSAAPSDSITAFVSPAGIDADEIRKRLQAGFGIYIAGGQESLKGKIARIGHMGYVSAADILMTLSALECVLLQMGVRFEPGKGVRAAEEVIAHASADRR